MGSNRRFRSGDRITIVISGITYHGKVRYMIGNLCRIVIELSSKSGRVIGFPMIDVKAESLRFENEKFDIE